MWVLYFEFFHAIQVFGENSRYIELFLARYEHICLTCIVPLSFSKKSQSKQFVSLSPDSAITSLQ